jgi:hypothetical protein
MEHYTYLFGAGASAPTLPINKGLLTRLQDIITLGPNHLSELTNINYVKHFENTFTPIINEALREISIDTLAHDYIHQKDKLHHIKCLIWMYFSSITGFGKINPRYKNLLLKIGEKTLNRYFMNNNVSFLSWNYDLQIEEAFSELDNCSLDQVQKNLYSFPGLYFTDSNLLDRNSNLKLFGLIHLNGCAGYYYDNKSSSYHSWIKCDYFNASEYDRLLKIVVDKFYTNTTYNSFSNSLSFSNLDNFIAKKSLDYSIDIASKTTHLIIVGYSFPDFNKIIDKEIISNMTHLTHIYIQDPNPEKIFEKIMMDDNLITQKIRDKEIKTYLINNVDEFYLPYSYKK